MKKALSILLYFFIFTCFLSNNIALTENSLLLNKNDFKAYSVVTNKHGIVIKTSIGIFYLGNNQDAIHEASGYRRYGYWEANNYLIRIYISDEVYTFYL